MRHRTDSRGVSTVLNYGLTLGITTIIVTGLVIAAGGAIQDQREEVLRSEFGVVGEKLSGDISSAERLGRVGDGGTVTVERSYPNEVAGSSYTIRFTDDSGGPRLVLESTDPAIRVTVPVALHESTDVGDTTISGGDLIIHYGSGTVEVTDG